MLDRLGYNAIATTGKWNFNINHPEYIALSSQDYNGGPGAAMYLDKHNKILFAGDNICSDVSGCGSVSYPIEECSLYKFRECMRKLVDRIDEIDWIFPEHFICDLENRLLVDFLEALDFILEDPEHNYDFESVSINPNNKNGPPRIRKSKYVKGFSVISYSIVDKEMPPVPAALRALSK